MNLSISKKINLGYFLMVLLIGLASGAGYYGATKLEAALEFITTKAWNTADGAMEGTIGIERQMIEVSRMAEAKSANIAADHESALQEAKAMSSEALGRMRAAGLLSQEQLKGLDNKMKAYISTEEKIIAENSQRLSGQLSVEAFENTKKIYEEKAEDLLAFIGDLEAIADGKVEGETENIAATISFVDGSIIAIALIALILAIVTTMLSRKIVVEPIEMVSQCLADIAEGDGDLTVSLPVKGNDEITALSRNFNTFVGKIRKTIVNVADSSTRLSAAAEEMSAIAEQTNQSIGQQRSETEQLATAMNEMAATVQEVARNAAQASDSAKEADNRSREGKSVVSEVRTSMNNLATEVQSASEVINRLNDESVNIGSVLDVIKSIAEQTNLLALNAAIEAARAGEQGRGFAVVADEVRTLAGKTQQSTQEIQEMIERLQSGAKNAVQAMEKGQTNAQLCVGQTDKAGEVLNQIAESVKIITDMNTQIASAAEEQGCVAEEINRNVIAVNNISNETSSGAQNAAQASEELARLAQEQQDMVRQFKT